MKKPDPPASGNGDFPNQVYAWYVVSILTVAYIFSFIDRQILNLLVEPIRYEEGHKVKSARKLPATLLDALRLLEKNRELRTGLGDEFVDSYIKLKMQEWGQYTSHLSDWERKNTLDC